MSDSVSKSIKKIDEERETKKKEEREKAKQYTNSTADNCIRAVPSQNAQKYDEKSSIQVTDDDAFKIDHDIHDATHP